MKKSDKIVVMFGTWVDAESKKPPKSECLGDYWYSEPVIVTDGKHQWVGYFQTWDDTDYLSAWKMSGPDGYRIDGVTHWMPLPPLPVKAKIKVELEPEGLEGIEHCVDCKKPTRYWKGKHTPICLECADSRNTFVTEKRIS